MIINDPTFGPIITIFFISFLLAAVSQLSYKFLTNQNLMKDLKEQMSSLQKKLKETKEVDKLNQVNKDYMDVSLKYQMQSLRPSLVTIFPFLLVLGWMGTHVGNAPLYPDTNFGIQLTFEKDVNSQLTVELPSGIDAISSNSASIDTAKNNTAVLYFKGKEGIYDILFKINGSDVKKRVVISTKWEYAEPTLKKLGFFEKIGFAHTEGEIPQNSKILMIKILNPDVHPFGEFNFPNPFKGFRAYFPGWVMTYFLFMIGFTLLFRKLLNIY